MINEILMKIRNIAFMVCVIDVAIAYYLGLSVPMGAMSPNMSSILFVITILNAFYFVAIATKSQDAMESTGHDEKIVNLKQLRLLLYPIK
jgi:hypothetical protein